MVKMKKLPYLLPADKTAKREDICTRHHPTVILPATKSAVKAHSLFSASNINTLKA